MTQQASASEIQSPRRNIVLMSPAGDFSALHAAIANGADAVYFGVGALNMRSRAAANFKRSDLPEVMDILHQAGKLGFLTLNTELFDSELAEAEALCQAAAAAKVDAVIASDFAAMVLAQKYQLSVHASVQCNVSNTEAVRFFSRFADAVVLARELTLEQIAVIAQNIQAEQICGPSGRLIQIEVFIHGALCIALSGRCTMSLAAYNASANRGACLQNCRRRYKLTDLDSGNELITDTNHILSPKDLCMIRYMRELIASGASIFKIEGRGRSADYVATVTHAYHQAIEACLHHCYTDDLAKELEDKLLEVFHRGFWHGGFYLGNKLDMWSNSGGSQSSVKKIHVGRVTNFFARLSVAELSIETETLQLPARLLFVGNSTGAVEFTAEVMRLENGPDTTQIPQKSIVSLRLPFRVREGDQLYRLENRTLI